MAFRFLGRRRPVNPASAARSRPTEDGDSRRVVLRNWLLPFGVIAGVAIAAFLWLRLIDLQLYNSGRDFLDVIVLSSPEDVGDALGNVSEVLIAILGLVITVVAIVVQLASQRYTPKLVDLFVADKINIAYFTLMVVASMYSLLLVYSIKSAFLPFWGSLFLLAMTTVILGLLIPYFNYVFLFLTPGNIIRIIRKNAQKGMERMLSPRAEKTGFRVMQNEVANSMEQISDISLSAVSQMDRNLALMSIRTLKEVMVDHLLVKRRMPRRWFHAQKDHFPAVSTEFLQEIYQNRTWVEMKGFLDLELIFKQAINDMPDAVSAVANSTKVVGLYAIRLGDHQVLRSVIEFYNTFLRLSLNNRNPKALYNLYYQYRLLAESVLDLDEELAEKIAFYFKYYGQIAQNYNVPMILVTAAFDLAHLLRKAYEKRVPNIRTLIRIFLEVDDNPATQKNEFDLRSVRKAQLNFASYLLSQGDRELVKLIVEDIVDEPWERLHAIKQEMMAVKDRKFWEVTDRGVDFFYLDETQKHYLNEFYEHYIEPRFPPAERDRAAGAVSAARRETA